MVQSAIAIGSVTTYDRNVGRYRNSSGKFVSRAAILKLVDEEAARLSTRLQAHARLLTNGKISLSEFQLRMAEDLKLSVIRSTILGSGGKFQTTNQAYGSAGRELREQYSYLANFAQDLAAGKLTRTQALNRAASYGASTRTAFHRAEKIARGREGFKEARRDLDVQARHCRSCLMYATRGWVPIQEAVPIGSSCECGSKCRCRLSFRRSPFRKKLMN